jgi:hypothetical protein
VAFDGAAGFAIVGGQALRGCGFHSLERVSLPFFNTNRSSLMVTDKALAGKPADHRSHVVTTWQEGTALSARGAGCMLSARVRLPKAWWRVLRVLRSEGEEARCISRSWPRRLS